MHVMLRTVLRSMQGHSSKGIMQRPLLVPDRRACNVKPETGPISSWMQKSHWPSSRQTTTVWSTACFLCIITAAHNIPRHTLQGGPRRSWGMGTYRALAPEAGGIRAERQCIVATQLSTHAATLRLRQCPCAPHWRHAGRAFTHSRRSTHSLVGCLWLRTITTVLFMTDAAEKRGIVFNACLCAKRLCTVCPIS